MPLAYSAAKYRAAVAILAGRGDLANRLKRAAWEAGQTSMQIDDADLRARHQRVMTELNQLRREEGSTPKTVGLMSEDEREEAAQRLVQIAFQLNALAGPAWSSKPAKTPT